MTDYSKLEFHPICEKITDILCRRTLNFNPSFFRLIVNYWICKLPAMMRVNIKAEDLGLIPINMYALNLAPSGHGKTSSRNIMEQEFCHKFIETFKTQTVPVIVEQNLAALAVKQAAYLNEDEDTMLRRIEHEYASQGEFDFAFDSATTPAIRQLRYKLNLSQLGSINMEIDEIANNLLGNLDVLSTFLELFDVGIIKNKLTKNTAESKRAMDIDGRTPTNLIMFGNPNQLLNGGKNEEELMNMWENGYGRRCFIGYTGSTHKKWDMSCEEIFDLIVDPQTNQDVADISNQLGDLANPTNHNKTIIIPKNLSIDLLRYRKYCELEAAELPEHEEIAKAEMAHRYFKTIKLAGAYAFLNGETAVTTGTLNNAIALAEESGKAFQKIHKRERNYKKLARYIANVGTDVTHVDLTEDLPFYKGGYAAKQELIQLATAWGYKNHIIIKRVVNDQIEFLSGATLQETDLDRLILAYSADYAEGYKPFTAPYLKLHQLTQSAHKHWINHHVVDGHRSEDHILPGFNMIVLDVDGKDVKVQHVKKLLGKYMFLLHTTKRHTSQEHRFRIVMPLNYKLDLEASEFKIFMQNILEWLPFEVDEQTTQRSRKWMTHPGQYLYSPGQKLLDARWFIPKTAKNDQRKKIMADYQSLTNLERWFVQNSGNGNRNNQLLKYSLMLVDMGVDTTEISQKVLEMNAKFKDKLSKGEIKHTIFKTVNAAILKRIP